MATFVKVNSFVEAVAEKVHNLGSDTLAVLLTNTVPTSGQTGSLELTPLTPGSGYNAGGLTASQASSLQSAGTYKLVVNDLAFTASGGTIGPFQWAVLYNITAVGSNLIGYWSYGSAVTLQNGETFLVDFDGGTGVLTIA